jgi:hypothetical protein
MRRLTYLITYDLDKPGQNYTNLITALTSAGGVRILLSTWLVQSAETNVQLSERYQRHIDANDRLFITAVSSWAYFNIMNQEAAKRILPP